MSLWTWLTLVDSNVDGGCLAPMSVTSVLEVVRGLCYERRPATDLMLSRLLLLFWVNVRTVLHTERADGTMTSLKRPSFPFILFTL